MKNLLPFKISLHENKGDKFTIDFYCLAEEEDHAEEQAIDAYPNCEIINVLECSTEEYPYAIHDEDF